MRKTQLKFKLALDATSRSSVWEMRSGSVAAGTLSVDLSSGTLSLDIEHIELLFPGLDTMHAIIEVVPNWQLSLDEFERRKLQNIECRHGFQVQHHE